MALASGLTRTRATGYRLGMLVSLVVSVSLLSLAGLQSAGAATKPDHLVITHVTDGAGHELPLSAGSFMAPAGVPVFYTVEAQDSTNTPTPVSGRTTIYLSENGEGSFGTPQGSIPSRGTQVIISATYALATTTDRQDYNVQVTADDDTNPAQIPSSETGLLPYSAVGNFIKDFTSFTNLAPGQIISAGPPGGKKKGGGGGTATVYSASSTTDPESLCTATATTPTCVVIELNNGANGYAVLTMSDCAGYAGLVAGDCRSLLVSFLANLKDGDNHPLYGRGTATSPLPPLTMIFKCDTTTCGGGGVSSYTISVDPENDGTSVESPACLTTDQNAIDDSLGTDFCTDYNASHRDGAQDMVLYLRLALDFTGKIH